MTLGNLGNSENRHTTGILIAMIIGGLLFYFVRPVLAVTGFNDLSAADGLQTFTILLVAASTAVVVVASGKEKFYYFYENATFRLWTSSAVVAVNSLVAGSQIRFGSESELVSSATRYTDSTLGISLYVIMLVCAALYIYHDREENESVLVSIAWPAGLYLVATALFMLLQETALVILAVFVVGLNIRVPTETCHNTASA